MNVKNLLMVITAGVMTDSLKNKAGSLKVFGRQVLSVYLCTIETHDE